MRLAAFLLTATLRSVLDDTRLGPFGGDVIRRGIAVSLPETGKVAIYEVRKGARP